MHHSLRRGVAGCSIDAHTYIARQSWFVGVALCGRARTCVCASCCCRWFSPTLWFSHILLAKMKPGFTNHTGAIAKKKGCQQGRTRTGKSTGMHMGHRSVLNVDVNKYRGRRTLKILENKDSDVCVCARHSSSSLRHTIQMYLACSCLVVPLNATSSSPFCGLAESHKCGVVYTWMS